MANNDYPGLVTSQHQQSRFTALVAVLTQPLVDAQTLLASLPAAFDVDTAVGVQLDAVGLWAGITRVLRVPLSGVYFAWGVEGVGWAQGIWKGPYDPESGLTSLPDDVFRRLIKARIAANAWNGSIPGAYDVWESAFADTGSIIMIQDNQDMSMVVGIAGMRPDAVTQALLMGNYIPLKPEGVRVSWYAVTQDGGPLMAWGCQSEGLAGWGMGMWPIVLRPTA
ncbi:DUF2612 domain-containing protein [Desulfovibrio desulfuricans]|uniref:DUF2612 domain-containing protein n=1 Tax=Desulfovibrio desulfuricans TaxID=876 RepID=UPI00210CBF54|nr:DUF2612 domain-containing protein [Desulfovibrio desulfuricans]MCQ4861173.1 DUF2612 domain-containing protein [Desulfovibrio desulfuricans]